MSCVGTKHKHFPSLGSCIGYTVPLMLWCDATNERTSWLRVQLDNQLDKLDIVKTVCGHLLVVDTRTDETAGARLIEFGNKPGSSSSAKAIGQRDIGLNIKHRCVNKHYVPRTPRGMGNLFAKYMYIYSLVSAI